MGYDIFLSYRRKESSGRSNVLMARTFKLEFEKRGYKVFFDYSECTDNYFSETILPAIRTCNYFVLILTEDCLSRCVNEGDWVRREIEEALAYNRKIIPITPDNECGAWLNLPDSLRRLDGLQITTIHTDHMFEACVGFLIKNRFHIYEVQTDSEKEIKRQRAEGERIKTERKVRDAAERERWKQERRQKPEDEQKPYNEAERRVEEEGARKSREIAEHKPREIDKHWKRIAIIGGLVLLIGGLIGLGFGLGWFDGNPEETDWSVIRRVMQYN